MFLSATRGWNMLLTAQQFWSFRHNLTLVNGKVIPHAGDPLVGIPHPVTPTSKGAYIFM
jgi:hypothetical protein